MNVILKQVRKKFSLGMQETVGCGNGEGGLLGSLEIIPKKLIT